jgi:uncharacterized protein (TIGR02246 family)
MSDLEARVRALEEELAIYRLIAAYGPAIDAGAAEEAAALWHEDGTYDTYPRPLEGRAAIAKMVVGDLHRSLLAQGCAHIQSFPHVTIDGDHAVATLHSLLLLRDDEADGFRTWRAAANRWELARDDEGGWRITSRVNRLLDGSRAARELLRRGL